MNSKQRTATRSRSVVVVATTLALLAACSPSASPSPPPASAAPSMARQSASPRATTLAAGPSGAPGAPIDVASLEGRIVFGTFDDVYSVNADGTDLTRLTDAPGADFDPVWSPDGTRIAFRSERSGDSEIWVMNADGSDEHKLSMGLSPAWSPDGSRIAYASPGTIQCPPRRGLECTGISIMKADGSDQHRVPNTDVGEYPTWSPDGKRIAFNSNFTGEHRMFVVEPDGSNLVDLGFVDEGWQVDWSPDGRSILFTSHRDHPDNYTDIYVMRPDGSEVERLTTNAGYTPAWSPDGAYFVYCAPNLVVMRADGSGMTVLPVSGLGELALPDWTR